MAEAVKLTLERDNVIGAIGKGLMGSFLEHVGRAIYTGIYEPGHPDADSNGFREDVKAAVREMNVPLVRYPGGNFVSGYRWTDGLGEKSGRPKRLDLAWKTIETNQVGIDDFANWAEQVGSDVMPAVNMGTGSAQDAADMVEYCNFKGGSYWSDKRRENGRKEPYGFRTWCVGNEMDGDWQIGHLNAMEYGRKANEAIKMMKWIDGKISVTVAGSSSPDMPSYPEWDRIVLEQTYDNADYLSLHRYYGYQPEGTGIGEHDYLHSYLDMDAFIRAVTATADYVKAYKRSSKVMMLSFDEWNVWHAHRLIDISDEWTQLRQILEDHYTIRDALLFSGMMMTLINHADRVKIGCMAQLVNVIAPILTQPRGGMIRQTIFYPYQAGCRYAKGEALRVRVQGEKVDTRYGAADPLYTAAAYDEENGRLTLFVLNSNSAETVTELNLTGFGNLEERKHLVFGGNRLDAVNSFEEPEAAVFADATAVHPVAAGEEIKIPGYTFHVLCYEKAKNMR